MKFSNVSAGMKRTSGLVVFVAVFVTLGLFAQDANPGEGIPVGETVFYPAMEVVYTHSDNIFLVNENDPIGEVSDHIWLYRPQFRWDFPFDNGNYLRLGSILQYRDYGSYNGLNTHYTYFLDLDGAFNPGEHAHLTVRNHYVRGTQEVNQFDADSEIVFNNARFYRDKFELGADFDLDHRNALGVFGDYEVVDFGSGLRSFSGYRRYNAGLRWKLDLGPKSVLKVEYRHGWNSLRREAADAQLVNTEFDQNFRMDEATVEVSGSFTPYLSGFATVGARDIRFKNSDDSNFFGFVSDVGLRWQPAEYWKVDTKLFRHTNQSRFNVNNYYVANGASFELHHQATRWLFWSVWAMYQRNKYPDAIVPDFNFDGFAEMNYPFAGIRRRDNLTTYRAELGLHPKEWFSMRFNYQHQKRKSNVNYYDALLGYQVDPYTFDENRWTVQLLLGW